MTIDLDEHELYIVKSALRKVYRDNANELFWYRQYNDNYLVNKTEDYLQVLDLILCKLEEAK